MQVSAINQDNIVLRNNVQSIQHYIFPDVLLNHYDFVQKESKFYLNAHPLLVW